MIPALPDAARILSGLVLRPGHLRWDGQRYTGPELAALDIPDGQAGLIKVLRERDFIGLIATRPELAQEAAARLQLQWRAPLARPDSPGDGAPAALERSYHWPLDSRSPAHDWAMAWRQDHMLVVWSAAPTAALARELSHLLGLAPAQLHLLSNGNPVDTGALDSAADAALLAWSVDRPVRVPRQNLAGVAMATIRLQASLDSDHHLDNQHIAVDASLRDRPSLARLLSHGQAGTEGKTVSPYLADTRISVRAAALPPQAQGKQDAALVFAQESFIDEAAALADQDPVAYRLAHLPEGKGRALVQALADHAGWDKANTLRATKGQRHGRGFAYAHVRDDTDTPPQESWTAWVAEVSVDERNGEVQIARVVVGHEVDSLAPMTPPAPRLEEHLGRAAQDLLASSGRHDDWQVQVPQAVLPSVDVLRPVPAAALAWSESASLPAAAAIANAIYDATGIRLREPGFAGAQQQLAGVDKRGRRTRRAAWLGGAAVAAAGLAISVWPFKSAIAPIDGPDLSLYSATAIERGRLVAAASDCVVCHTAPEGKPNTGGLALDTPFGVIYTTNITPDKETGIGRWSYAAFERAMRQGIHRDGRQLYPAFPYTAFAKLSDGDMQSLYAYLMSQPAVAAKPPETRLAFPYNVRPLMAGWNALFHDDKPFVPDASQSQLWNRGAYLVQGAGHCGACHTPRNALGAEKSGAQNFLAGGSAEGWEAPALNALSRAPLPWTEDDLYRYLRTGYSERHGVAAGPMAPVIHGLAELPDNDVRAIAHYLSALNPPASTTATVASLETASAAQARVFPASGERVFQGACAVCHDSSGPKLFGARPSLALNSNLHSQLPDNLVQVILRGIPDPANGELGYMPGFGDSLNAQQINDLVVYLRARFAPDQPAWSKVPETIERLSKH